MLEIHDFGEYKAEYSYHLEGNRRRVVDEILAYFINEKQMTRKEIEEAGFMARTELDLQQEFDEDFEDRDLP